MSSFGTPLRKVICLALFGLLLHVASPARADDGEDMIRDAHHLLTQAADAVTDADREGFLNAARKTIENLPPGSSTRHVKGAIKYIKSALFELGKGDPNHLVDDYIQDADKQVRDLE
jgi:hypothetical protein